ncbi:MAG: GTP-binding protein [Actinobacteria bacterium]|nr:GTP-binding protein [Actinomycetota bacterium]
MPTTVPARIRNVAIIAHIDHGKTTLIDAIFRAAHVFRENARVEERVMDSHDLERERGITIRSKHCTVEWGDHRINIIDTPGHADFSGEVERVLSMVDSVLLLVDANEGPMPQTRYVLMRALRLGMRPLVIINKADRPNADPQRALDLTFDLFLELGATDHQADFPVLYGSGLEGWLVRDLDADEPRGMDALFEAIIAEVPAPQVDLEAPFRMQVSTLAWSDYIGRIGCGRVLGGRHRLGEPLTRMVTRYSTAVAAADTDGDVGIHDAAGANGAARTHDHLHHVAVDTIGSPSTAPFEVVSTETVRSTHLWVTDGLGRAETEEIAAGDIVWLSGPPDLSIGDTLCAPPADEAHARAIALPPLEIEEPTVSMFFLVNTGPFAGNEGRAVTLRQIRDRLEREARVNVALRVEDLGRSDGLKVSGRGELHLAILIEEMRREGMEMTVSRPEVITHRDAKGRLLEPYEELTIEVPEEYQGVVIEKLSRRKGDLTGMQNHGSGTARLEFSIPTRGLLGYRTDFLTDTRGLGIMTARVTGYGKWAGEVAHRDRGSLVSMDTGVATGYQLESLQSRGTMFVSPMDRVYVGMVIGEHTRPDDLVCNPTKTKKLGNYRSENKEIDTGLKAVRVMNLDQALEWIADDELVEVTPTSVRIRKTLLDFEDRRRADKRSAALEPA